MRRFALAVPTVLVLLVPGLVPAQVPGRTDVTALIFSRDGSAVISAGQDGTLRRWDALTGRETLRKQAHTGGVYALALSPDGKTLASAGEDRTVRLWEAADLKEVRALESQGGAILAVAFAPDGKTLAAAAQPLGFQLWDVASGKLRRRTPPTDAMVTALAFTPDGKQLLTGGTTATHFGGLPVPQDDEVRVWDVATCLERRKLPVRASALNLSADGRLLAGGGFRVTVGAAQGRPAIVINGMALSAGTAVWLWDMAGGREVVQIADRGSAVALSPDGRWLASGYGHQQSVSRVNGGFMIGRQDRDSQVRLWEGATGQQALLLHVPDANATVLAFSADGTRLAAGKRDGTIGLLSLAPVGWDAARAKALDAQGLEKCWADLAAADPARSYEAVWTLAAAGAATTALLKEKLRPAAAPNAGLIRQRIEELNDDRYAVREKATRELRKLGFAAEAELKAAVAKMPECEAQRRALRLLEGLQGRPLPAVYLQQARAIQVLEHQATAPARAILRALTAGPATAWLTQEAQRALDRLAQRP